MGLRCAMNVIKKYREKEDKQITTKSAIKKAKLVELWRETRGHISKMCSAVGVTRKTFYVWLKEDEEFNQAIQDAESELNDDVRDALVQKIADGSSSDIQFYLNRRHPDFKQNNVTNVQVNFNKVLQNERQEFEL